MICQAHKQPGRNYDKHPCHVKAVDKEFHRGVWETHPSNPFKVMDSSAQVNSLAVEWPGEGHVQRGVVGHLARQDNALPNCGICVRGWDGDDSPFWGDKKNEIFLIQVFVKIAVIEGGLYHYGNCSVIKGIVFNRVMILDHSYGSTSPMTTFSAWGVSRCERNTLN